MLENDIKEMTHPCSIINVTPSFENIMRMVMDIANEASQVPYGSKKKQSPAQMECKRIYGILDGMVQSMETLDVIVQAQKAGAKDVVFTFDPDKNSVDYTVEQYPEKVIVYVDKHELKEKPIYEVMAMNAEKLSDKALEHVRAGRADFDDDRKSMLDASLRGTTYTDTLDKAKAHAAEMAKAHDGRVVVSLVAKHKD